MTNPSKLEQVADPMVTRVAWAMFKQHHQGSLETPYWLDMARAAIAAMELPTEEMVEAGRASQKHMITVGEASEIYAAFVRSVIKEEK